nr:MULTISPECIES: hypothetical protein [Ruminococcus]
MKMNLKNSPKMRFILTKVQMRIRRAIMKQQSGFIKSLPIWEI